MSWLFKGTSFPSETVDGIQNFVSMLPTNENDAIRRNFFGRVALASWINLCCRTCSKKGTCEKVQEILGCFSHTLWWIIGPNKKITYFWWFWPAIGCWFCYVISSQNAVFNGGCLVNDFWNSSTFRGMPPLGNHEHGSYWGEWMAAFKGLLYLFWACLQESDCFVLEGCYTNYLHVYVISLHAYGWEKREHPFNVRSVFQEQNWYHRYTIVLTLRKSSVKTLGFAEAFFNCLQPWPTGVRCIH